MKATSLLLVLLLASCTNRGPRLSGEWRSKRNTTLIITQDHDTYFVKTPTSDFMGKYEDGRLKIGATPGDIQYSEGKDKLYFAGEEFSRKEFLEAEALRIHADKATFHGTWKKVPKEGGQMLSSVVSHAVVDL